MIIDMKWYRKLYLGEGAKKAKYKMFGRIRRNRFTIDTYLITLSDNPNNLMDMFSANVLNQPYYKKKKGAHTKELYVVGLAAGYEEGLGVIRTIIDDVYRETGAFDIRCFLKFGQKCSK